MSEIKSVIQPVETSYIQLWKEGSIVCGKYADNLHITLDIAKEIVAQRIKFSENRSSLCYVDMRGVRSATREARAYLANEGSACVIAGAMLIDSVLTRTLGNIFLTINKPKIPVKLFTDKDEAIQWLNQKLEELRP
jgi:hypothetical protein